MGEEGEYIYLSLHCHHQNDSSKCVISLVFFFVCFCLLLHSIGFMLFITKVRAEPWVRTPET